MAESPKPARGVALSTLVLSVLLAAAIAVAVMFALRKPGGGGAGAVVDGDAVTQ